MSSNNQCNKTTLKQKNLMFPEFLAIDFFGITKTIHHIWHTATNRPNSAHHLCLQIVLLEHKHTQHLQVANCCFRMTTTVTLLQQRL